MAKEQLLPDRVLVSTARRTTETWNLVSSEWIKHPPMLLEESIYEASATRLLDIVQSADHEAAALLLIGHNPGFEVLARLLTDNGDGESERKLADKFPTAALAVIDFPVDRWADITPRRGRLERFVTPRELGVD